MTEKRPKKPGLIGRLFAKDDRGGEQHSPTDSDPDTSGRSREESALEQAGTSGSADNEEIMAESALDDKRSALRLRQGLSKTRSGFVENLGVLLGGKKQLNEQLFSGLEEVLVKADIGVKTAYELLDSVTERVKRRELSDPEMVVAHLKGLIKDMLSEVEAPLNVGYRSEPFVIIVVGVNGSGKTTTMAKIAARHQAAGRKVLLVAGDTFRAAAVEQLEIWGERIGCPVVKGKEKADPSSVAFEAMERAVNEDVDLVLVDTAGRLHTRAPLMEQLKKINRTLGRKIRGAPHETLLVIDASTGQNAIMQARTFNEAISVTGIALTKLDGTSKGGVLLGIANELKFPVRYIGIGEKMDDLRDFNAGDFVEALFDS